MQLRYIHLSDPPGTPGPPATVKVRGVSPARRSLRDETLIHSGRMLPALHAMSPADRSALHDPPRRRWPLVYQWYPPRRAERFQLHTNGECQRSLKSWAQAVSPECSAGLWNTPNYDKALTFFLLLVFLQLSGPTVCKWVYFLFPSVLSDVMEQKSFYFSASSDAVKEEKSLSWVQNFHF